MHEHTHAPAKKIAVFDICNTLVSPNTISDFTENFFLSRDKNPNFSWVAWFRHRAWVFVRGRTSLFNHCDDRKHLVSVYRGFSPAELSVCTEAYTLRLKNSVKESVLARLNSLKAEGYSVYLVSAGLDVYLKEFAQYLGVRLVCTNMSLDSRGRYRGEIEGVDCIGEGKILKLESTVRLDKDMLGKSYSFGDSFLDIPLLSLFGHAVAVDPDPALEQAAQEQGWEILKTHRI